MTILGFITNTVFFFSGVCFGIVIMCLNKINNGEHKNEETDF